MAEITELITWHPASEPPDNERMVLVRDSTLTSASFGHFDGMHYRNVYDEYYRNVIYWAERPIGPTAEAKGE